MLVHAAAEKIIFEKGRAVGVTATVAEAAKNIRIPVTIRAQAVVVACGAIHSPALLLRSGLRNPALGKNLHLHPATALWGEFEQEVRPWTGTMQAVYSDQFARQREGYGVKFETAPVHPSLFAVAAPWRSGTQFWRLMEKYSRVSVVGLLTRDRDGGSISINRQGLPVVDYRISKFDQQHVRAALHGAAQVLAAAGAKEIFSSQMRWVNYRPRHDLFDEFVRRMDAAGYGNHQTLYFTFHQMGSCRMGGNRKTSVIDENNEGHDARALFVTDASAFPSASGVNPMLTIMAIAHRAAQYIATRV
jgi:choline dehydrogenase-like flavoprotein